MAKSNAAKIDAPKTDEIVIRLRQIQAELKLNLSDLHQKLETLNLEPEVLPNSFDSFKDNAESRASSLEAEVKQLREQITAIKELLGLNKQKDLADSN
jgi:archaellum component FlaC